METINRPFLPPKKEDRNGRFRGGGLRRADGRARENRLVRPPPSLQFIIKPHKQKSTERHGRGEEEKKRKKTKTKTKKDWSTAAPEKGLVNRRPIPSTSPAVITQMRNNPLPHALLRSATMRCHMLCYGLPRCAATCAATVCHDELPHALLRSAFSSVIFISRCHIC